MADIGQALVVLGYLKIHWRPSVGPRYIYGTGTWNILSSNTGQVHIQQPKFIITAPKVLYSSSNGSRQAQPWQTLKTSDERQCGNHFIQCVCVVNVFECVSFDVMKYVQNDWRDPARYRGILSVKYQVELQLKTAPAVYGYRLVR